MSSSRSLRVARSAAVAYTAAFAVGSAISVRRGYVAEPLGIRTGNSVTRDVVLGNGAGLAAPWNMIVQMWVALTVAQRPGRTGRRGRAWLAFLAAMFVAGAVGEPVSHKVMSRELPPADATVAVANIVLPIFMLGAALASLVGEGRPATPAASGGGQPRW